VIIGKNPLARGKHEIYYSSKGSEKNVSFPKPSRSGNSPCGADSQVDLLGNFETSYSPPHTLGYSPHTSHVKKLVHFIAIRSQQDLLFLTVEIIFASVLYSVRGRSYVTPSMRKR
jgi:hypothetical protein